MAQTSLLYKNKKLNTSYLQSVQVYIRSNFIYSLNRQWKFKAGYMAENSKSRQEHRGYDKKSIGQEGLLSAKGKWDKNQCVILLQQGG